MGGSTKLGRLCAAALPLLAGLGVALAGCSSQPAKPASAAKGKISAASRKTAKVELPAKDLDARGLEKRWDFDLGEDIRNMWLLDDAVYVYTGRERLYALGLADGLVRWQYDIPGGVSFAPATYSYKKDGLARTDELFVVSRDTLQVLDRDHGFLLWKLSLPFAVSSAPAASASHCYIGSWDGRIYAIGKDDHAIDWSYRTDAPITARAEAAEKSVESVFVGSGDGRVYSFLPTAENRKWYYRTLGAIEAPPYFFRNFLYVGSSDYNLYAIRSLDGNVDWRYAAGAPITKPPIAFTRANYTKDNPAFTLYAIAGESKLLAITVPPEPKKEKVRWSYPACTQVIACGRRDVYVRDTSGAVTAISDETGKERWAKPLKTGADFYVTDPFDPKSEVEHEKRLASTLVLGYRGGTLIAIREKAEY